LKGLNYLKGRDDPVALEDEEYPEWLWHCLDVKKKSGDEEGAVGDLFCIYSLSSSPYHFHFSFALELH
jgi:large subunit ribosomal protein L54